MRSIRDTLVDESACRGVSEPGVCVSKSKRTKQREQVLFMLSLILLVVALGLLIVGGPSPTRWLILVAALANAATFGFLRRTH